MFRQTGTVSELAIAFQNITNTISPRWPDHPLIYLFPRKLKEHIRFELTDRGSLPPTFHAYLAAAISVEQIQAAATSSRSHGSLDLDDPRGHKGALTMDERRRRSDGDLCAYCGLPVHTLATCAAASRSCQARGTIQHIPLLPPPDSASEDNT